MGTARTGDGGPHTPPQPPEGSAPLCSWGWGGHQAPFRSQHLSLLVQAWCHTCHRACAQVHTCVYTHTCTHTLHTCMHATHAHVYTHAPHLHTHITNYMHACTYTLHVCVHAAHARVTWTTCALMYMHAPHVCTYRKLHVCVHISTTRMYACHTCMPHACPHHARHTHSAQPPARQPRACRDMNGPAVGTRLLPAAICSAPRCTPPCLQTSALPSGHRSKWISGSEVWLAFFY